MTMRIALLDDDAAERSLLMSMLQSPLVKGWTHTVSVPFARIDVLQKALKRDLFDLVLLDLNLREEDGTGLLKWMREELLDVTPVIVVSARSSENEIAEALDFGADDYIVKPVRPLELRARVLRFCQATLRTQADAVVYRFGNWKLDRRSFVASYAEAISHSNFSIRLTPTEFRLAVALFQNIDAPVSRSYLVDRAGYPPDTLPRVLDSQMYKLRRKLGLAGERGYVLRTIYGSGYRLLSVA